MTTEFDPAAYRDEYREALLGVIEAKAGGAVTAAPAPASAAGVTDLMAASKPASPAARNARASAAPKTIEEAKARPARRAASPAAQPSEAEAEAGRPVVESRRSWKLRVAGQRPGTASRKPWRPEWAKPLGACAASSGASPALPYRACLPIPGRCSTCVYGRRIWNCACQPMTTCSR